MPSTPPRAGPSRTAAAMAHPVRLALAIATLLTLVGALSVAAPQTPPATSSAQAPLPSSQSAAPGAVPAGRAATNVAVITIRGPIDEWTELGVRRRIAKAVADGADAVVFDIDTPGGDLLACLKICDAIKACPIANTVAWINPAAYSAGSIIALACREIVVNDPSTFGDALPIQADWLGQIHELADAEREKMLGPLLAEVVDSARRHGYDEMLVQGLVRRGVELWLIENPATRERYFVTADQYEAAVGAKPVRGTPGVPSATGGAGAAPLPVPEGASGTRPSSESPLAYQPASPTTSSGLASEVTSLLELKGLQSRRPDFRAPGHAGKYRPVEYVSDGHGMVLLKADAMRRYGLATATVRSDSELRAYFGAASVARLDETWSEALVRFLSNSIVKGLLLIVFLVALFIEMTHPGVVLPGAIAALCLVALVVPPVLVNLAAWWAVAAVIGGLVCLAIEVFLIPGFGVFGVLGILLLFGGMIGIFVGGPGGLFPTTPRARNDLAYGAATVLISTVTSLIVMYFVGKHLPGLPVVNRLVLKHRHGDDADGEGLLAAMGPADDRPAPGATGRALTPLRPAGRAEFGDRIVDVVADMGFIDAGAPVRIVSSDEFRIIVERA